MDCNGGITAVDALKVLRHIAGLSVAQNEPCPGIGEDVDSFWGDVDCSGNVTSANVTSVDALKILRYVAGQSVAQWEPCTGIGQLLPD